MLELFDTKLALKGTLKELDETNNLSEAFAMHNLLWWDGRLNDEHFKQVEQAYEEYQRMQKRQSKINEWYC